MAGLHSSTKLSPSASSLLLLSLLLLSLAAFTFFLQRRDEIGDPQFRLSLNRLEYSVMDTTTSFTATTHLPSNCVDTLGQSRSISFPYFRHWKLSYKSNRAPKIGITSSTSAGLEQILPWIYYHKVIGVTNFFLFVEGEAASPAVSKVLESIPNVKLVHRTTKLEEEQAKRYRKHVVWTDKHLNKKLIKEGILTRIYAPMVIMQELKETGVYASLINSVQTSLSNDTFLSHNEIVISNSSKAIDAAVRVSSRKIGKKESQMAVRNVLEVVDTRLLAMPPLPSAVMEVSF